MKNSIVIIFLSLCLPSVGWGSAPMCADVFASLAERMPLLTITSKIEQAALDVQSKTRADIEDRITALEQVLRYQEDNLEILSELYLLQRMLADGTAEHWHKTTDLIKDIMRVKSLQEMRLPDAELVEAYIWVTKRREGDELALAIAKTLVGRDPSNKEYKIMEMKSMMRLNQINEVIAETDKLIATDPDEIVWYEYQAKARARLMDSSFRSYESPYRSNNSYQLWRVLEVAVELDNPSFYVVDKFAFITFRLLKKGHVFKPGDADEHASDVIVLLEDQKKDLADHKLLSRIDFRLAQMHFRLGDLEKALFYIDSSLALRPSDSRDSGRLNFRRDILNRISSRGLGGSSSGPATAFAGSQRPAVERDHTFRDSDVSGDTHDDRPDWEIERDEAGGPAWGFDDSSFWDE